MKPPGRRQLAKAPSAAVRWPGSGRCGLAAAEREVVKAGGKAVEVVRVRITAAGRRAIED